MKKHRLVSNRGKYCYSIYAISARKHKVLLTYILSSFSFLYKYWYIVLPLALMGLFGGVEEEPAQDTRQRAPAVAATGAAAAAAAGTAASGGQARKRRGKRD